MDGEVTGPGMPGAWKPPDGRLRVWTAHGTREKNLDRVQVKDGSVGTVRSAGRGEA